MENSKTHLYLERRYFNAFLGYIEKHQQFLLEVSSTLLNSKFDSDKKVSELRNLCSEAKSLNYRGNEQTIIDEYYCDESKKIYSGIYNF